jgi:hypothetical protein
MLTLYVDQMSAFLIVGQIGADAPGHLRSLRPHTGQVQISLSRLFVGSRLRPEDAFFGVEQVLFGGRSGGSVHESLRARHAKTNHESTGTRFDSDQNAVLLLQALQSTATSSNIDTSSFSGLFTRVE